MKIAYITIYDALDIVHAWSGTGTFILKTLEDSGFDIYPVGNLAKKRSILYDIKSIGYYKLLGKNYLKDREPGVQKYYAAQVEKELLSIDYDLVFCPGTSPITYLKTDKPIVVWLDATFASGIDFYPDYSNLCAETIKKGNKTAQIALSKCRLALFSSDWAAEGAKKHYHINPKKVRVVPFGANINCDRNSQYIKSIIEAKNNDLCKLLFIGVDWCRKGGDFAVIVAKILNERGINTQLHVVGCQPEGDMPDFVIQHGFISKEHEEGRRYIDRLMTESHFFILPSRAEMFGVVFAEASSFGLPSLATRVGGIPTAIHDGKNGQTFDLTDSPEKYCDYIQTHFFSKHNYEQLALSSFSEYTQRLNWDTVGKNVHDLIYEFCN